MSVVLRGCCNAADVGFNEQLPGAHSSAAAYNSNVSGRTVSQENRQQHTVVHNISSKKPAQSKQPLSNNNSRA